jgi:hypothetical protein
VTRVDRHLGGRIARASLSLGMWLLFAASASAQPSGSWDYSCAPDTLANVCAAEWTAGAYDGRFRLNSGKTSPSKSKECFSTIETTIYILSKTREGPVFDIDQAIMGEQAINLLRGSGFGDIREAQKKGQGQKPTAYDIGLSAFAPFCEAAKSCAARNGLAFNKADPLKPGDRGKLKECFQQALQQPASPPPAHPAAAIAPATPLVSDPPAAAPPAQPPQATPPPAPAPPPQAAPPPAPAPLPQAAPPPAPAPPPQAAPPPAPAPPPPAAPPPAPAPPPPAAPPPAPPAAVPPTPPAAFPPVGTSQPPATWQPGLNDLLLVMLAAIIAAGAFYLGRNHHPKPVESTLTASPTDRAFLTHTPHGASFPDAPASGGGWQNDAPRTWVEQPPRAPPGVADPTKPLEAQLDRSADHDELANTTERRTTAPAPDLSELVQSTGSLAESLGRLEETLAGRVPGSTGVIVRPARYETIADACIYIQNLWRDTEYCIGLSGKLLQEVSTLRAAHDEARRKYLETDQRRIEAETRLRGLETENDEFRREMHQVNAERARQQEESKKDFPVFMLGKGQESGFLKLLRLAEQKQPELADRFEATLRSYAATTRHGADENEHINRVYEIGERLFALLRSLDERDLPTKNLYEEAVAWMTEINNECHGKCSAYIPVIGAAYNDNEMSTDRTVIRVNGYRAWGVKNSKRIVVRTAKVE